MPTLEKIIERFNDGDFDPVDYFGGFEQFFNLLKKKDLFSELDPIDGNGSQSWQNRYMLWLLDNDKEKFYYWITKILSDVEVDESGKVFLVNKNTEDLSSLFCEGYRGNSISVSTIEKILSGDGDILDYYHDTTDDVFRDVIEELNEKNIQNLYDYILLDIKDTHIPTETELLEELATKQGHPEYVIIDRSNIKDIVDDEETMEFLLDNILPDLKSNLYSIHSAAYNNAYESDLYDEVWEKLSSYFEGRGEFIEKPHPFKKDITIQHFRIPIVNFETNIRDFLVDNLKYTSTLENEGDYLTVIKSGIDCLKVWPPDYPSYRKVDENINSFFTDYI